MFYKPAKERQWDSWIFRWKDVYYMYYINVSDGGTRWDGISLARSRDLIHWEEYGRVLQKDDDAVWLGTGMVQRIGKKFIMNYSLEKPKNCQQIYFAESEDLLHWKKVEGVVSAPDGEIYRKEPSEMCDIMPRWDSLGVFEPLDDNPPPYYAFCTANVVNAPHAGESGVLGFATSDDGLHWTCLEPAFSDPTAFTACEVPEYFRFENRHYAIFCASSYLGFRRDSRAKWASGGTYYLVADRKTGPYRLPKGDPMLQGTRDHSMVCMNYVGRTFKDGNKRLFYHIWGEPNSDAWMGAIKELVEEEPYRLALKYYSGNEKLKGKRLLSDIRPQEWKEAFRAGVQPAVFWDFTENAVTFTSNASAMCLCHSGLGGSEKTQANTDLADGRVVECNVHADGVGFGLFFETVAGNRACVFFNRRDGRVEFGHVMNGWGGNCFLKPEMSKEKAIGYDYDVRILARRQFLEAYIGDDYVAGWRLSPAKDGEPADEIDPNRFGIYSEDSNGYVKDIAVWQMQ